MTTRQRITLNADWWPAACRAQGWKTSDRALRLRVCAWAVSLVNPTQLELVQAVESAAVPPRFLASTNDLDNGEDVDRVKACLLMLADSVKAADEVGRPQLGSARRKRDVIRGQLQCLELFVERPKAFLGALVEDMFNHGRPGVTIRDLTDEPNIRSGGWEGPSDLARLVMRMAAVVNQKRNENVLAPAWQEHQGVKPMTIHEMKILAGVRCDCAACRDLKLAPIVPELEENWKDFEPELETAIDEFGGVTAGNPF